MKVCIIVPVFNSEASLPQLVARLEAVLGGLGDDFELLLVNDASRDASWQAIEEAARGRPWIRGVDLMRNYGQHNALLCGVKLARYDVIVMMDDDLQHPPEEIPTLLNKLSEGYDVVYGVPREERHQMWRNIGSRLTKLTLQTAMGAETARRISSFKAFRTGLRNAFAEYSGLFVYIDALFAWGTTRFGSVVVRHDLRTTGTSNYSLSKLVSHAFTMMTAFTAVPLQIASLIGSVFMALGGILLAYVLIAHFPHDSTVPGFTFLAAVISIFSGVQLFSPGMIGEYLVRMHFRLMGKPDYVVRRTIEGGVESN